MVGAVCQAWAARLQNAQRGSLPPPGHCTGFLSWWNTHNMKLTVLNNCTIIETVTSKQHWQRKGKESFYLNIFIWGLNVPSQEASLCLLETRSHRRTILAFWRLALLSLPIELSAPAMSIPGTLRGVTKAAGGSWPSGSLSVPWAAAADGECGLERGDLEKSRYCVWPWGALALRVPLRSLRFICLDSPLLFLKSLLAHGLGRRRFRMTAGARGEGCPLLGSALLIGSEEQFQGSDLLSPSRCCCPRHTVCSWVWKQQCLRWQPLLFRWSLLPRQETAALAGSLAFPTLPRFKETDFTTFF